MEIKTVKGKKNKFGSDRMIGIRTIGGQLEVITNKQILELIEHIFSNENIVYPRPKFKGSKYFMDEIKKLYSKHIDRKDDDLQRYR